MNKFFKCSKCGKIVQIIENGSDELTCCNTNMLEIKANTVEAAIEKHIPVIELLDDKLIVSVGSTTHPMEENHYIKWISVKTNQTIYHFNLNPGDLPKAELSLRNNEIFEEAYAYCNLHGLWKSN